MIRIKFEIGRRGLVIVAPADVENLPVTRQAFRAFAQLLGMPEDALGEAELGVTEAVSNVIKHAYAEGDGQLRLELEAGDRSLRARIEDDGGGIPEQILRDGRSQDGFGLVLMNGVARDLGIDSSAGGTRVTLEFELPGPPVDSRDTDPHFEAILRRVLTVVGAQADLSVDRLTEAALAGELLARHSAGYLDGDVLEVRMDRTQGALLFHTGPYVTGGAGTILAETEAPVVGRVVEKLADQVIQRPDESGAEWLEVRLGEVPESA
jgi:anti-sigma regulatory factor (Ser/Thr protein kinase)